MGLSYRYYLFVGLNISIFFPALSMLLPFVSKVELAVGLLSVFFSFNIFVKSQFRNLPYRSMGWMILFLLDTLLMAFHNRDLSSAISSVPLWIVPLSRICLFVIFLNTPSKDTLYRVRNFLIVIGFIQATIGICQTLIGWPVLGILKDGLFHGPRNIFGYIFPFISVQVHFASGTFEHFNGLGNFLLLVFLVAAGKWVETRQLKDLIIGLFLLIGIYCTFSRGALLGAIIGSLYLFFKLEKRKRVKWAFVIFAMLVLAMLSNSLGKYLATSENAMVRFITWTYSIDQALKDPSQLLFGYGLFHFRDVVLEGSAMTNLHSSYLQIFLEFGAVGFFLYSAAIVQIIRYSLMAKSIHTYGLIILIIGFTVSQLVENSLFGYAGTLFYVMIALYLSQTLVKTTIQNKGTDKERELRQAECWMTNDNKIS